MYLGLSFTVLCSCLCFLFQHQPKLTHSSTGSCVWPHLTNQGYLKVAGGGGGERMEMAIFVSLLQAQELSWRKEVIVEILGKPKALFSKQSSTHPHALVGSFPPHFFFNQQMWLDKVFWHLKAKLKAWPHPTSSSLSCGGFCLSHFVFK